MARSARSALRWYPSSAERGGLTAWLSWYSAGTNWWVSPPWNPYHRSKPRPEGPGGTRARHVGLILGAEVPLADRVRRIAVCLQDLGQVAVLTGRLTPVAGVSDGQVGHPAHTAAMVVTTGQQARRGWASTVRWCGSSTAGSPWPPGRRAPGFDVRPEAAELGESDVVEDDEDDIGRSFRWGRGRRPPGLRAAPIVSDLAAERFPG